MSWAILWFVVSIIGFGLHYLFRPNDSLHIGVWGFNIGASLMRIIYNDSGSTMQEID